MSILTDGAILAAMDRGEIVIRPFDRKALGGNSYDVHLSPYLMTYVIPWVRRTGTSQSVQALDCKEEPTTIEATITDRGFLLQPGQLYLASTVEYTETHMHVPVLDGKSSMGRLGVWAHITAGFGDIGFRGHWTLEIVVVHPIIVYPQMPVGQLRFHTVEGRLQQPYDLKHGAKYTNASDPRPQASRMYRNFDEDTGMLQSSQPSSTISIIVSEYDGEYGVAAGDELRCTYGFPCRWQGQSAACLGPCQCRFSPTERSNTITTTR